MEPRSDMEETVQNEAKAGNKTYEYEPFWKGDSA
jgi:hypothetical protein